MKRLIKQISKILIRIILLPRLIKHKFFNSKNINKINVNNNLANKDKGHSSDRMPPILIAKKKELNKIERNKYGFPSYNEIKKLIK